MNIKIRGNLTRALPFPDPGSVKKGAWRLSKETWGWSVWAPARRFGDLPQPRRPGLPASQRVSEERQLCLHDLQHTENQRQEVFSVDTVTPQTQGTPNPANLRGFHGRDRIRGERAFCFHHFPNISLVCICGTKCDAESTFPQSMNKIRATAAVLDSLHSASMESLLVGPVAIPFYRVTN